MKTQKLNPGNSSHCQLFSKLKALKQEKEHIQGIPIVESDSEESTDHFQFIQKQLHQFKHAKAREVAALHNQTKQSIQDIVLRIKHSLQTEALSIINPGVKDSIERGQKDIKDMGSTLPGSKGKQNSKETPGFDFPSSKSKNKNDPREFTLGQRGSNSSNRQPLSCRQESEVSEFIIPNRKNPSRKIKEKIMNSQRNQDK